MKMITKSSLLLLCYISVSLIADIPGNILVADARGATFYVSTAGNDSNDGRSEDAPWRTIPGINETWNVIGTGDDILCKRGDVFTEDRLIIQKGGVEDNQLVIGAYGVGQNPAIDGVEYCRVEYCLLRG